MMLARGLRRAPLMLRPRVVVQRALATKPTGGLVAGVVEGTNTKASRTIQHWSNLALLGLVPAAFILSPSPLSLPVDLTLGVLIPVHTHIGMNEVIGDYVPKASRTLARVGWLGVTVVMFLGFLRVNIQGPGITESIKTLWRESPRKQLEKEQK